MEGLEFEQFCGELLRRNGYKNVTVTKGSGDQGVDILAEKDQIKIAVQCKCYTGNVGNNAIQEACTGKLYYDCHVAAVLTTSHFTSSAKELANKTGILLWDRDTLEEMIAAAGFGPSVNQNATNLSQSTDSLLAEAIRITKKTGSLSIFELQRRMNLDYNTAVHLIDKIDELGIVEPTEAQQIEGHDILLDQAIDATLEIGMPSPSILQRKLKIGYSRASHLIDEMEELGIVGPHRGDKPREILIEKPDWEALKLEAHSGIGRKTNKGSEAQAYPSIESDAVNMPLPLLTDLIGNDPNARNSNPLPCSVQNGSRTERKTVPVVNSIKKVLLWFLSIFMALSAISFIPSFFSIFAAAFAVLCVPIPKLQGFFAEKRLSGGIKIAILIALFIACLVTVPNVDANQEDVREEVQSAEQGRAAPQSKMTPAENSFAQTAVTMQATEKVDLTRAEIDETTIYDQDGVSIAIVDLDGIKSFKYRLENQSEKDVAVMFDRVAVNNCMVPSWTFFEKIAPGKSSIESYDISNIEKYGFESVAWIDLHYQVCDGESTNVLDDGYAHIDTSIADSFDQAFEVQGDRIYSGDMFSAYVPDKEHRFFGSDTDVIYLTGSAADITNLVFYNQHDSELSVYVDGLSVNGVAISDCFYCAATLPNCYSVLDISILDSKLGELEVSSVDEIAFRLVAHDAYDREESTEEISLDFNQ